MNERNLKHELERVQHELNQEQLLHEARRILSHESGAESRISSRIRHGAPASDAQEMLRLNALHWQGEANLVFTEEAIETICIRFRLRFLDSTLFKGEVPAEAVRTIKRIEAETGMSFRNFRIVAPAERFRLRDSTKDPMLFASLSNGKYLFIHQWGNDLSWHHHIVRYPLQHMGTLTITALAFGLLINLLVSAETASLKEALFFRFFLTSASAAAFMTVAIIFGIMRSKDFSENVWNSNYLK